MLSKNMDVPKSEYLIVCEGTNVTITLFSLFFCLVTEEKMLCMHWINGIQLSVILLDIHESIRKLAYSKASKMLYVQ